MIEDDKMIEYFREEYGSEYVDTAIQIYAVLAEECGAYTSRGERANTVLQQFVQWFANDSQGGEFRFQGGLGFGGKFWDNDGRWYVNYYREDHTAERDAMEAAANARLAELKKDLDTNQ